MASLLSVPFAYAGMQEWLEEFAYHTGISWWVFVIAGAAALALALLTVSYQAFRVARTNPVEALRCE
jgi:putative ABC transport system permease protein